MANDTYNPIAESITVEYRCPECGEITVSDAFGVPTPDFGAEKARDSENSAECTAVCEHCGAETPVDLYSRYDDGYVDMPEVEEIIRVIEEYPNDDLIINESSDENE